MVRSKLIETIAQIEPCIIVMEACSGANHWSRQFLKFGDQVKCVFPASVHLTAKDEKAAKAAAKKAASKKSKPAPKKTAKKVAAKKTAPKAKKRVLPVTVCKEQRTLAGKTRYALAFRII